MCWTASRYFICFLLGVRCSLTVLLRHLLKMIAGTVHRVVQKPLDTRCLDSDCCQVTLRLSVYCIEHTLMYFFYGSAVMTATSVMWGSAGGAPRMLNLTTRCWWALSFVLLQPLTTGKRNLCPWVAPLGFRMLCGRGKILSSGSRIPIPK